MIYGWGIAEILATFGTYYTSAIYDGNSPDVSVRYELGIVCLQTTLCVHYMRDVSVYPPKKCASLSWHMVKKNADPPSRINFRHFLIWEQIDGGRPHRTNILKGLFRHIYIEKDQIKCFNFSFLGWGLKVTYNSDIFEKMRPPHGFSNVRIWI